MRWTTVIRQCVRGIDLIPGINLLIKKLNTNT